MQEALDIDRIVEETGLWEKNGNRGEFNSARNGDRLRVTRPDSLYLIPNADLPEIAFNGKNYVTDQLRDIADESPYVEKPKHGNGISFYATVDEDEINEETVREAAYEVAAAIELVYEQADKVENILE